MSKNKKTLPVDLDAWFNDMSSVEELREIVNSETFQKAAATLKEAAGPSFSSLAQNPEQNALRMAWYAGYRDAFTDLAKMTKFPVSKNKAPEEWDHVTLNN